MISQEKAIACLESESNKLKKLSYKELVKLAELQSRHDEEENIEIQVGDDTVYISTTFAKFGRLRKRVSVEMVLGVEGEEERSPYRFVYFERYKSGRFYPSPREEAREAAVFKMLPYVCYGGLVIGLMLLIWHFFL